MALVTRGKTQCPICQQVLEARDDIVMFSAFISEPTDPLWLFNDAAFHRDCFAAHPFAPEADRRWHEILSAGDMARKKGLAEQE